MNKHRIFKIELKQLNEYRIPNQFIKYFGKNLDIRTYTSGICCYKDKYLLLRIGKHYKICPGDWEWLTCSINIKNISNSKELEELLRSHVYYTLDLHTGLKGRILKLFPPHIWYDDEFNLIYILYPIFIKIETPSIKLNREKFVEYEWVEWEKILNFDRNNYLRDFLNYLNQLSYFDQWRKRMEEKNWEINTIWK